MGKRKAIFFDIDGTLWDINNYIPDSTAEAIKRIWNSGNLAFICSGRARAYIRDPKLLRMGFDGIISGCGTMIEFQGDTLFYHKLDPNIVGYAVNIVRSCNFRPILEGRKYLYMDKEDFKNDPYGKKLINEMGDNLRSISKEWCKWEVSKLSCAMDPERKDECFAKLKDDFDFMVHNPYVVEMVPKGFDKGTGLLKACNMLRIDPADTFAFGDSVNDLGMLRAAGTAIVMGNGSDEAKAAADYVTASLEEDGIFKACEHFGLF